MTNPYSDKPVKFKTLTSSQLRDLRWAKRYGELGWRSSFTLVRRGLVRVVDKPDLAACIAGLNRKVEVTPEGEAYLKKQDEYERSFRFGSR